MSNQDDDPAENPNQQRRHNHNRKGSMKRITRRRIIAAGGGAVGLAALAGSTIAAQTTAPGPIDTAMTDRTLVGAPITKAQLGQQNVPVKRIGRPEEVARAVLWLSTDEASFVTGTFLTIDGGIIAKE